MTEPTNHTLTINLPRDGRHVRACVVYLQPPLEHWHERLALMQILCQTWLEPHWYLAIYIAGDEAFAGYFMPYSHEARGHDWLFKGVFERDANS